MTAPGPGPGPARDEAAEEAILTAALDLSSEVGVTGGPVAGLAPGRGQPRFDLELTSLV